MQKILIVTWIHKPNHGFLWFLQMRQSLTQKKDLRWHALYSGRSPSHRSGNPHSSCSSGNQLARDPGWGRAALEPGSGHEAELQSPFQECLTYSSNVSVGEAFLDGQITWPKDMKNTQPHSYYSLTVLISTERNKNSENTWQKKVMWTS